MALSYQQYQGDGSTRAFAVPFKYISKDHVLVKVDGTKVVFTWLDAFRVQPVVTPGRNAIVEVRRETPRTQLLVDFVDGSTLVESDLDLLALQTFYLTQEAFDQGEASLSIAPDGSYSANNRRISSTGTPTSDNDVVTRKWVLDTSTTSVSQAITSAAAAASARDTAVTKAGEAAASSNSAASSASQASTQRTQAQTARTGAEAARDAAVVARTGAETALGKLNTQLADSQAARDAAVAAKDTVAQSAAAASSSASTAITQANAAKDASGQATAQNAAAQTAKQDAQSAASTASTKASEAAQSAAQAQGSANTAATQATQAGTARANAEAAQAGADTARQGAETAKSAAETARDQAVAAAGQSSLPTPTTANKLTGLRLNSAGTAYEQSRAVLQRAIAVITANTTLNEATHGGALVRCNNTSAITVTLPSVPFTGWTVNINRMNTGAVNIAVGSSKTIGGVATPVAIEGRWDAVELTYDGSNYQVVSQRRQFPPNLELRSAAPVVYFEDASGTIFGNVYGDQNTTGMQAISSAGAARSAFRANVNGNTEMWTAGGSNLTLQVDNNLVFYVGGVPRWTAQGGWTSDATLKTDVTDLNDALAAVNRLRPVTYHWKDRTFSAGREYGFLAQEIEAVLPEAVETLGETKMVRYQMVIPLLTKALQELAERVKQLEAMLPSTV